MTEELMFRIALSLVPGIGPFKAKKLLAYCGSARAIFREKPARLIRIPEIGEAAVRFLTQADVMSQAEQELDFILQNNITTVFYTESDYPERLRLCDDGPILLYTKGRIPFNSPQTVAIVGTRKATDYGKQFCEQLIHELKSLEVVVISGLAYGIDIWAHKCAIRMGLPTIACLAHGLDIVYPPAHSPVAHQMLEHGGLVTEYPSATRPDRELFPMRNRIIAGLADCTVVIETDLKGGSIITAHLASSYGREVFALPGRHSDIHSTGCNELIRKNIAAILTTPGDLAEYMNWNSTSPVKPRQLELFETDNPEERLILKLLQNRGKVSLDVLCNDSDKNVSAVSAILLTLEFKGAVKSLPGKIFELA